MRESSKKLGPFDYDTQLIPPGSVGIVKYSHFIGIAMNQAQDVLLFVRMPRSCRFLAEPGGELLQKSAHDELHWSRGGVRGFRASAAAALRPSHGQEALRDAILCFLENWAEEVPQCLAGDVGLVSRISGFYPFSPTKAYSLVNHRAIWGVFPDHFQTLLEWYHWWYPKYKGDFPIISHTDPRQSQ